MSMALCDGADSSVPWQGTTVAASANARTAGSIAASSAAGVAAVSGSTTSVEILVFVVAMCHAVVMSRGHDHGRG